jgi:hypothetical protein
MFPPARRTPPKGTGQSQNFNLSRATAHLIAGAGHGMRDMTMECDSNATPQKIPQDCPKGACHHSVALLGTTIEHPFHILDAFYRTVRLLC